MNGVYSLKQRASRACGGSRLLTSSVLLGSIFSHAVNVPSQETDAAIGRWALGKALKKQYAPPPGAQGGASRAAVFEESLCRQCSPKQQASANLIIYNASCTKKKKSAPLPGVRGGFYRAAVLVVSEYRQCSPKQQASRECGG